MAIELSHSGHLQCIINATASVIAENNWISRAIKERGENDPLNHLLQHRFTHGYIFQQCQVVFICQVAITVQVVCHV